MNKFYVAGVAGLVGLLGIIIWKKCRSRCITKSDVSASKLDKLALRSYHDVTAKLTKDTVVYPGDPTLEIDSICEVGTESCFGLSKISLSNHMGTHIDFPSHVLKGGKNSSDYSVRDLIGNGVIIEIPKEARAITKKHLQLHQIERNSFVFFKTRNSYESKSGPLLDEYVYIESGAVEELLKIQARVVGIDYISVDSMENDTLPVHHRLLKNNILIVENLDLRDIDPGKCIIHISPLNIPEMDGLPARVIIER